MRRETQNILLVLLGGALLKIGINGDYLRYVKPAQQPWVVAGGAVILLLGAVAIVRDVLTARQTRTVTGGQDHDDPARSATHQAGTDTAGHDHHHPARSAWLLVVPVLAVFLVAPPALGSDSVIRTSAGAPRSAVAQDAAAFPPLPAGDVVPLTLTEFVTRAGWDSRGSLNGRTVRLSGFVVHAKEGVLLARMVIRCCAADASPMTVRLTGPQAARFPDDSWLEVTGQLVPGTATAANGYTPDVTVTALQPIPAPQDAYEY
ncbi:TIGR03943 family protein [Amycolatopsis thermalba]|uniref:TIGR03943 family protein n=1 Tax=Amycolatopsis thermalba TaxID=944492 RepID=A0ABY4NTY2_9PSEU|nr:MULTISPECIES: TIGR03943 family protein [Amycolatopsis]OXM62026.1 TIGR03943 family protein [Amycolatopsis sp. KNN50.9b]UQS23519.1 TIGR03943 family protein [Amycolatopsis thermalba]